MSTADICGGVIVGACEQDAGAVDQDFERLFREHYRVVYRTARGVLGNAPDAEDVAQTVFLRLVDGWRAADPKRSPGAYLYRAAVNESLNVIRARKRHPSDDDLQRYAEQRDASASAAESAEQIHRRLYEAVAELHPRAAEILILRYVHDRTDTQIAQMLGTSRGTVAVSLYRSRVRLRKVLRAFVSSGGRS